MRGKTHRFIYFVSSWHEIWPTVGFFVPGWTVIFSNCLFTGFGFFHLQINLFEILSFRSLKSVKRQVQIAVFEFSYFLNNSFNSLPKFRMFELWFWGFENWIEFSKETMAVAPPCVDADFEIIYFIALLSAAVYLKLGTFISMIPRSDELRHVKRCMFYTLLERKDSVMR